MVLIITGMVGFACIRFVFQYENRRRAKKIAEWTAEELEAEKLNPARRGNQKLTFVYGL